MRPTPAASPTPTPLIHVVKQGEWLDLIARRYGISLDELIRVNRIQDPNRIEVGQKLIIPRR